MKKTVFIARAFLFSLLMALNFLPYQIHESKAEGLGNALESFGSSIGEGLENLGQQLNRANNSFLNAIDGRNNANSYEAQMRQYRQMETARINELAQVTGVSPDHIQELRSNGMTWEQIADKYGVNLDSLPSPQMNGNTSNP